MRLLLTAFLAVFLGIASQSLAFGQDQADDGKTTFSDIVSEVRFGVLAHNIPIGGSADAENQEEGENVQVEILFHTPKRLRWKYFFDPEPYIVGSWNTAGNTSFGGFGLNWDWQLGKKKRWEIETSLGYIVHSGEIDIPFPNDLNNPANAAFDNNNILFGSRDLFRTTLALNRHIGERWGAQLIYEHLSHGQIIGDGRNQGNDSVGGRIYYRFGRVD
ncbi:MAG: hypothetical protein AAF583_15390 [Pseudomonadota bacterium]